MCKRRALGCGTVGVWVIVKVGVTLRTLGAGRRHIKSRIGRGAGATFAVKEDDRVQATRSPRLRNGSSMKI